MPSSAFRSSSRIMSHTEAWKIGLILFAKFAALLFGGIAIISVLKLAFGA